MYKQSYRLILLTVLIISITISGKYVRAETSLYKDILIISKNSNYMGAKEDMILLIEAVLGHYQVKVERMTPNDYINSDNTDYDVIMVVVFDGEINEPGFGEKLARFKGSLIWAGKGIGMYDYPVTDIGEASGIVSVNYREKRTGQLKEYGITGNVNIQKSIIPGSFRIYSWFSDGRSQIPFISTDKNLTYISSANFSYPVLLNIFADFLNNILYRKTYNESSVYVHLEGINIFSDFDNLKNLADLLNERNVSFTFGLIPYIIQEGTRHTLKFNQSSRFVETLKYMQNKGGLPVIHPMSVSTSDQRKIMYTSYVDSDKEIRELENNIRSIIRECIEAGIYPAGAESKYFKFMPESYRVIKNHFNTYFGEADISGEYRQNLPYRVSDTALYENSYPINLGTYNKDDEMAFGRIDAAYEIISMVEGNMGGLYFPAEYSSDELNKILNHLESKNRTFFDFQKLEYKIETDDYRIILKNGTVKIDSLIEQTQISLFNRTVRGLSYVVQGILVLSILVFMFFVTKLYLNARKNMFTAEDDNAKNDR